MSNRLLVINDHHDFAAFVAKCAEESGYETQVAASAADFRHLVDIWRPTHLVVDLVVAGTDGVEILHHLAAKAFRGKVLLTSALDARVTSAARRLGGELGLDVVASLNRPVGDNQLRAVLEQYRLAPEMVTGEALAEALERGDIVPFYQPKIDLRTCRPVAFEALARWRHPSLGTVMPDEFIPLAEAMGTIDGLGRRLFVEVVGQLKRWREQGIDMQAAINISAKSLRDEEMADRAEALCRRLGVPAESVTFEITESMAMSYPLRALDILTRLRIKGFKLSIDDFGTGYSSLAQLQRLPFSELKIDKAFVRDCHSSEDSGVIAKTIIDLAHNLEMQVVAEGAETIDTVATLANMGCDLVQGFAAAPAMEAAEVPAWIAAWPESPLGRCNCGAGRG